jgi:DNA-binding beta-propeller fold protein YncE
MAGSRLSLDSLRRRAVRSTASRAQWSLTAVSRVPKRSLIQISARRGTSVAAVTLAVVTLVGLGVGCTATGSRADEGTRGHSPARLTARSSKTRPFEYVVADGSLYVYSIDERNRLVQKIRLPQIDSETHGVAASPRTGLLYVSYGNQGPPGGSLLAYDLRTGRIRWHRRYGFGIDSMGISPNGRTIYMPAGEGSGEGTWRIIDAQTGKPTGGAILGGRGAHNTIVSADGKFAYLGGVDYPYLGVADLATNRVREIGPLNGPGVRPFTINGSQTLAFTTARSFLGFQVSSIPSGKVLYTVGVPGFSFDPETFDRTPDHGISLSPDEHELYLIDTPNGYVHVFDVQGLPAAAPRDVADIKLKHPPPNDGWLQHSRNGRYVYVGRAGDVIDTRTRKVVAFLAPLQRTADFLEIDWRKGRPVATTSRYGVGYMAGRAPAG